MSDDTKDKPDLLLVPDEEIPTEVVVEEEPNEPARIDQSPGTYPHVTPQESAKRQQVLARLLVSWYSAEEIYTVMGKQFGMTPKAVDLLETVICKGWASEDNRRSPYFKNAARRRLLRHTEKAAEDRAWGAVFKGEELISKIEGTQAPLAMDIHTTGEINHAHSFARLLNDLPQDELRELIESERKRLGDGSEPPIEVEAVPAEDTEPADV
jgi:hypothetical protein